MKVFNRILVLLAFAWAAYVGYSYIHAYRNAPTFEKVIARDCPVLEIRVFPYELLRNTIFLNRWHELIAWHNQINGLEIFTTDQSADGYSSFADRCAPAREKAAALKVMLDSGQIVPELRIKYGYLALILLVPMGILLLVPAISLMRRKEDEDD